MGAACLSSLSLARCGPVWGSSVPFIPSPIRRSFATPAPVDCGFPLQRGLCCFIQWLVIHLSGAAVTICDDCVAFIMMVISGSPAGKLRADSALRALDGGWGTLRGGGTCELSSEVRPWLLGGWGTAGCKAWAGPSQRCRRNRSPRLGDAAWASFPRTTPRSCTAPRPLPTGPAQGACPSSLWPSGFEVSVSHLLLSKWTCSRPCF